METELILKCDCKDENCNLSLVVTPLNSISLVIGDSNWIGGLHLSIADTKELIKKLENNIRTANELDLEIEKLLHINSFYEDCQIL